jgi:hypothetical protein
VDGVTEDGYDTTGILIDVHKGIAVNPVFAFPANGEPRIGFLEVDIFGSPSRANRAAK